MWAFGQICVRLPTLVLLTFGITNPVSAHRDDNSTARVVQKGDRLFSVDVSMLATDFESMFASTSAEEHEEDLSAPGALENAIGRFVLKRIGLEGANGEKCRGSVDAAGEDPQSDESVRVLMTWDCSAVAGDIFYNAAAFFNMAGPTGRQQVFIGAGPDAPHVTVDQKNDRFDVSMPHARLREKIESRTHFAADGHTIR
jgi:hypothetical protein